ncbi:phage adaptor protein [Xanthobacter sediminis]
MTYLEIMQQLATHAGVEPISSVSSGDADRVLFGRLINDAGAELARRVDWGALRKTVMLSGVGSPTAFALPDDCARLAPGLSVVCGISPVRGSLTSDEWASLPATMGDPRYFYLAGSQIAFYPYLRAGAAASVTYQSAHWAAGDTDALTQADDTPIVPAALLVSGAVWRWRRHTGKDFSDHMSEFEAQLADLARFDGGARQP